MTTTHQRPIRYDVRWILNRTHTGTPYAEVADEIARRADTWPHRDRARVITDALICHRRNRADYAWVMGPH